jgi:hypothetical protein
LLTWPVLSDRCVGDGGQRGLRCLGWMRCGVVWEPVREVALEAVQVRSGGAVADVAVGSDKVVRRLLHTQPREHLPADVCRALGAASRVKCLRR